MSAPSLQPSPLYLLPQTHHPHLSNPSSLCSLYSPNLRNHSLHHHRHIKSTWTFPHQLPHSPPDLHQSSLTYQTITTVHLAG